MFGFGHKKQDAPPPPVQPSDAFTRLQGIVDAETQKLHAASSAMAEAAAQAHSHQRMVDTLNQDIATIQRRLANGPDATLQAKLATKQAELDASKVALGVAQAQNQQAHAVVMDYEKTIAGIKQQASELGVTLHLAEAENASAKLKQDLNIGGAGNALDDIKSQIANVRGNTTVINSTSGPKEDAAFNAELLKAAEGK